MSEYGSVVPLESDPAIFTDFARRLGLSPLLAFFDIYSISDPDLVAFLPRPLNAIILLFPITKAYEALRAKEQAEQAPADDYNEILWFKQLLKNACGLYGLLHATANLPPGLIVNQSKLYHFIADCKALPGVNNGTCFDEKTKLIKKLFLSTYDEFSQQGQTEAPSADDDVDLHFICFTKGKNGHFYELDGRRSGPVDLGAGDSEQDVLSSTLVNDRIQTYMGLADEGNSFNFAMMGLGPAVD